MQKSLLKFWLRLYLWYHNVCPQHGPMKYWCGLRDGGYYCEKCEKEREARLAARIEMRTRQYRELT